MQNSSDWDAAMACSRFRDSHPALIRCACRHLAISCSISGGYFRAVGLRVQEADTTQRVLAGRKIADMHMAPQSAVPVEMAVYYC